MRLPHIIEVKSELGAGTRGASLGIAALEMAAIEKGLTLFDDLPIVRVEDENDWLLEKPETPSAKYVEGIALMYKRIAEAVKSITLQGGIPLVLSGDHSNAGGTIAGIKLAQPDKRLGVIWIDAHADLHSPYTSPSGNVHGMPLATALGADHLHLKKRDPEAEAIKYWEEMKNLGGICPKIQDTDLVFMCVRDTEDEEDAFIADKSILNITTDNIRAMGIVNACIKAINQLSDCDSIYISFDVDSMDSSFSSGTGTPVPGGITPNEANAILLHLISLAGGKFAGIEFTEVNPLLDKENTMAKNAVDLVNSVVNAL